MMPLEWLFMDLGNVVWSDEDGDAFTLRNLGRELGRRGRPVSPAELSRAVSEAVRCYAPSVWRAVIWRFALPDIDLYEEVAAAVIDAWEGLDSQQYAAWQTPFPVIPVTLERLAGMGLRLAIASNNSPRALARLDELDLLDAFEIREVSETMGLAKPDLRFFQELLRAAGTEPERVIMLGDRLDNDISPARLLGMKTVRLRLGSHAEQRPRCPRDLPDVEITDPVEIADAVERLMP